MTSPRRIVERYIFGGDNEKRFTQDSPIMPDVWLHYIRLAEKIAGANIAKRSPPEDTVDLLLTPWSGVRPGRIVAKLRDSLKVSGAETGKGDAKRAQRSRTRIALSDGIGCEQTETAPSPYEGSGSEEKVRTEVGMSFRAFCDVLDEILAILFTEIPSNQLAAHKRGIPHNSVETALSNKDLRKL